MMIMIVVTYAAWSPNPNAWLPSGVLARLNLGSRPAGTAARPAMAILPFLDQVDDSFRDYFADGLTHSNGRVFYESFGNVVKGRTPW